MSSNQRQGLFIGSASAFKFILWNSSLDIHLSLLSVVSKKHCPPSTPGRIFAKWRCYSYLQALILLLIFKACWCLPDPFALVLECNIAFHFYRYLFALLFYGGPFLFIGIYFNYLLLISLALKWRKNGTQMFHK